MKIKGRFIAVLAAVGLLAALLPALPTGAVAGVVTLTGGADGKGAFFSDNMGNNVVKIQVTDDDLSPARIGKARYSQHPANTEFLLAEAVLGGETEKVDKFSRSDATTPVTNQWRFELTQTARDRSGNGVLSKEDVSVEVNGQTLSASQYSTEVDQSLDGQGITHVTVIGQPPREADGSVVITYEITEYRFGNDTPLRLAGTEIHYGPTLAAATNQINVSRAVSEDAEVDTTQGLPSPQAAIVTFVYHVKDTAKKYVRVSTTTSGVTRQLDGEETTATTSVFGSQIGVVESSDYTKLTSQAGNSLNDTDTANGGNNDGTVQISELDNTNQLKPALHTKLTTLAGDLGLNASDSAQTLINSVISATHNDTLTVSYADASPAANVSKTAKIDLEAPVVTLIQPTNKLFTRSNVVTLQASVVDANSGVDSGDIDLVASFTLGSLGTPAPIQNGYTVTNVPSTLGEGKHEWAIRVEDRVGNTPTVNDPDTKKNEAALGAVAPLTTITNVGNPFVFTVDINGPVLASAKTGNYLKNAGVTSGDKQETEARDNREWVRATFNLGDGGAPLDAETVTATDFTVGGATPLEAVVNAKAQGSQAAGSIVYLKVAELDTSAKPAVRLTGEVRDKAGNPRTDGTIASGNVADGLSPTITVTPSASITSGNVTVTVSSSERLRVNPSVGLTTTKPVKGTAPTTSPLTTSLQTGALTTWVATYNRPADSASIQYVVVSASDLADNTANVGVAANDKDLISFQVDDADPGLMFRDATGKALKDSKQQEGAVWIVAEFDDDEYTGDTYRKVTLSSVALTDGDGNSVTSETGDLFGADDVACGTGADGKCATYTLAIDLTPGDYTIEATGTDAAGNSVTGKAAFKVTARAPFKLELKPGVNLISVPGSPVGDSGNLNILFEGEPVNLVTTFDRTMELEGGNPWLRSTRDPETGLFTGDISTLEPGAAYFVTAEARTTINITLRSVVGELPPTVMVRYGYNALGYSSIAPTPAAQPIDDYLNSIPWTVAYSYDPTPGRGWEVIRPGSSDPDSAPDTINAEPGKGYLVFSRFDATLTP